MKKMIRKFRKMPVLKQIEITGYINFLAFFLCVSEFDPRTIFGFFIIMVTTISTTKCAMMYEDEMEKQSIKSYKNEIIAGYQSW